VENKKKSPIKKKLIIGIFILITVLLAWQLIFGIAGVEARQDLRMTDTTVSLYYSFDMQVGFHSSGGRNFFYSTRDGIQNIATNGERRWQEGFTITRPILTGRGDMVAVGEEGGRSIYVFNSSGLLYVADLPYPALYYTVNPRGYLSVIMRTDSGYFVQSFNPANPDDYAFSYRAPLNDNLVFPFSIDVSHCGTYIVKALLDLNGLTFSRLTFSLVRRIDSRGVADGLFAAYDFPGELIAHTRFTACGLLVVVTDQRILGFRTDTQGYLWSVPFYNRPDELYVGENGFAFVAGEPFLNQPNADNPGLLRMYNFDGDLTGSYDLGRRATHLSMAHNAVLVGTERTFYAISIHGIRLWTYTATQDVQQMLFLENTDIILQAGGTRATVLRRTRQ